MANRYEISVTVERFDCTFSWGKGDPSPGQSGHFHNTVDLRILGTYRHSNRDVPAIIEINTLARSEPPPLDEDLFHEVHAVGTILLSKNSLRVSTVLPASKIHLLIQLLDSAKLSTIHLMRGTYEEDLDGEKRADTYYFFTTT